MQKLILSTLILTSMMQILLAATITTNKTTYATNDLLLIEQRQQLVILSLGENVNNGTSLSAVNGFKIDFEYVFIYKSNC